MASFTNQASLTYNGQTVSSNIVSGQVLDTLSVTKSVIGSGYTIGEDLTYVVSLVNSGTSALSGITLTDNLGQYTAPAGNNVTPLSYTDGTVQLYVNGVLQPTPTVADDDPLTITGLSVPAGGNILLIYEATPNRFASPESADAITNTVTVTGGGISSALSDTATVSTNEAPDLSITKNVSPVPVSDGGVLTYTFLIQNYGNVAADTSSTIVVTDTLNPILSNLTATLNGTPLTSSQYSYTSGGVFSTVAGVVTVPVATFTQASTGEWTTTPGVSTLVISGTV